MEDKIVYEWDEAKRQKLIAERGLDIAVFGPDVVEAADGWVEPDERKNYGEARAKAYAVVDDLRLCVCYTVRDENIRLITIYKVKEKIWRKHYENKNN
ncbi:MAG: BrnT family toxin [Rickettsiales bacterium]|jgi:uncharacterized DUF497 family protein|nr:BrnT family toxin [Rickettsiales bacterium]